MEKIRTEKIVGHRRKLAVLNSQFHTIGGMEKTIGCVSEMLSERGYVVNYLCFSKTSSKSNVLPKTGNIDTFGEEDNKNPVVSLFRLVARSWKIAKYCKKNEIGLLISNAEICNFSAILSKIFNKKTAIISVIHNSPKYYGRTMEGKVWCMLMKLLYPLSDELVVVSEELGDYVSNFLSIRRERITFLPNPLEKNAIYAKRNTGDRLTFAHVGRLADVKNQKSIIEAFDRIHASHGEVKLCIIGDGPLSESLRKYATSLNSSKDICFVGETEDIGRYLKDSDFFLFYSKNEGFGRAPMEAMAYGVPVITHDYEYGAKELLRGENWSPNHCGSIEAHENGILTPYESLDDFIKGIELAISHKFDRQKISEDTIRRYGWNKVGDDWLRFVARTIRG